MSVHKKNATADQDAIAAFLAGGKVEKIDEGRSHAEDLAYLEIEAREERRRESFHSARSRGASVSASLDHSASVANRRRWER